MGDDVKFREVAGAEPGLALLLDRADLHAVARLHVVDHLLRFCAGGEHPADAFVGVVYELASFRALCDPHAEARLVLCALRRQRQQNLSVVLAAGKLVLLKFRGVVEVFPDAQTPRKLFISGVLFGSPVAPESCKCRQLFLHVKLRLRLPLHHVPHHHLPRGGEDFFLGDHVGWLLAVEELLQTGPEHLVGLHAGPLRRVDGSADLRDGGAVGNLLLDHAAKLAVERGGWLAGLDGEASGFPALHEVADPIPDVRLFVVATVRAEPAVAVVFVYVERVQRYVLLLEPHGQGFRVHPGAGVPCDSPVFQAHGGAVGGAVFRGDLGAPLPSFVLREADQVIGVVVPLDVRFEAGRDAVQGADDFLGFLLVRLLVEPLECGGGYGEAGLVGASCTISPPNGASFSCSSFGHSGNVCVLTASSSSGLMKSSVIFPEKYTFSRTVPLASSILLNCSAMMYSYRFVSVSDFPVCNVKVVHAVENVHNNLMVLRHDQSGFRVVCVIQPPCGVRVQDAVALFRETLDGVAGLPVGVDSDDLAGVVRVVVLCQIVRGIDQRKRFASWRHLAVGNGFVGVRLGSVLDFPASGFKCLRCFPDFGCISHDYIRDGVEHVAACVCRLLASVCGGVGHRLKDCCEVGQFLAHLWSVEFLDDLLQPVCEGSCRCQGALSSGQVLCIRQAGLSVLGPRLGYHRFNRPLP